MLDMANVDLQPIGDVANNLINKISSAVGWIAPHATEERIAQKTYIEELKKSNLPPLMKSALISQASKTIKEYVNQANILQIAIKNMDPSSTPENIQDDWLSAFMDKARLISDEEFQLIWGHLLARECATPNSIPKTLLCILEQMDNEDANSFSSICSFSVHIHEPNDVVMLPIILYSKVAEIYHKYGITYESLSDLQSFGLIQIDTGRYSLISPDKAYEYTCIKSPIILHYFDEEYTYPNDMQTLSTGNVMFTKSGAALCKVITKVITVEKRPDFFKTYCIPYFEKDIADYRNAKKQELR